VRYSPTFSLSSCQSLAAISILGPAHQPIIFRRLATDIKVIVPQTYNSLTVGSSLIVTRHGSTCRPGRRSCPQSPRPPRPDDRRLTRRLWDENLTDARRRRRPQEIDRRRNYTAKSPSLPLCTADVVVTLAATIAIVLAAAAAAAAAAAVPAFYAHLDCEIEFQRRLATA